MTINGKKRLCVNLETSVHKMLTQMVEKYKIPISDIVNEIIKTSTNFKQLMSAINFNLFLAKRMADHDKKDKRDRQNKEKKDDNKAEY